MAIVRISLLAFICSGIVAVANSAEKGDTGIAPTDANTESAKLLADIQSQQELIESLERQKTQALMELEKAKANQPQKPGRKTWEDQKEFQARLTRHQEAKLAAQADVKMAQESVETAQRSVEQAQMTLAKMQTSQLPSARRKDERALQDLLERERQQKPQTNDDCYREGVLDRQCLSAHQQRTDSAVRDYYQSLQKSLEQSIQYGRDNPPEPDDPVGDEWFEQRLNMLVKSQTLWLEYRDTVCQAHAHEYQHGSLAWPVKMTCLIECNEARLQQLQNIYNPETE